MEIEIPEGIEVELQDEVLKVRGEKGEVSKRFYYPKLRLKKVDNKLVIEAKDNKRKTLAIVGTWRAHIRNMFKGVTKGFEYRMKICHVHFPMNVSVEGDKVVIKNFLGQKDDRYAKILEGVEVKVEGDEIIIRGIDKEKVGQTMGNIENATRLITRRDRRVFSDGIFLISRGEEDE
ncbi:MAG TPA: 50S ribosomal protein L6 [Candidatus Aenigmarchaeota archaeon]|nr:50S ribosomal protein L6 [Candidatus Aenigmarchaeota archaeon]